MRIILNTPIQPRPKIILQSPPIASAYSPDDCSPPTGPRHSPTNNFSPPLHRTSHISPPNSPNPAARAHSSPSAQIQKTHRVPLLLRMRRIQRIKTDQRPVPLQHVAFHIKSPRPGRDRRELPIPPLPLHLRAETYPPKSQTPAQSDKYAPQTDHPS